MAEEIKAAKETKEPEIKTQIEELSAPIAEAIKFNEQGNFTFGKDFVEQLLDEEGDFDTLKRLQKRGSEITYALTLAAGRTGVAFMKDNKEVDIVSVTLPFGTDAISASVQRKAEVGFGSAEKQTKYGYTNAKYIKGSVSSSSGQLKAIRTVIGSLAADELA